MRDGIGSISLYNIIIIFIAVVFALLAATLSYSKAFKVNSRIIKALETYEGYNSAGGKFDKKGSAEEIDRLLSNIGYKVEENSCKTLNGVEPLPMLANNASYNFCLYLKVEDTKDYKGRYFTYTVKTYMHFDLPIVGDFIKIPVTTKTEKIFCFDYPRGNCKEKLGDY